ncbi:Uncharacterised protein [Mycobacteroides abscessus subsp. massiliense]|nr:Uncharacterised protein [Mycobacteroides abscessus subsp. massiliense]
MVTEYGLAAEHREDLRHDAEERQGDDVDLGMPEEPEQVLPEDRSPVGRVEDMGSEVAVGGQTEQRGSQQRERDQHEPAGHQDVPGEDRHPEHRHTRGTHTHDGSDHVHRAQDGADPANGQTHDP